MDDTRILTVQVEIDSRKLGGTMLLHPFPVVWLESNTCRELLRRVLADHLVRPTTLVTTEVVKMYCTKQEVVTEFGLNARVEREVSSVSKMLPPLSPHVNDERVEDPQATQDVQEYHAMAKARLNDAMVSPIYMCGMAPL